jgi:hypothetical protein
MPKVTSAWESRAGVALDSETWSDVKLRQVKLTMALARNPVKATPSAASTVSSQRRVAGLHARHTRVTRMWPPALSVMAAPKVKAAAIR